MFPAIGASNYVSLGGNDHRYNAFMSYPRCVSLTKTSSRHTLKTGVDARMIRVNVWEARAAGHVQLLRRHDPGTEPEHRQQHRRQRASRRCCSAPARPTTR